MTQSVELPLWAFLLILLFAAVTFASHFLFPSVRWFFRRRLEKAVSRLNTRLTRPIEPFKLARRTDMIQRLIYDPQVTEAIVEYARSEGVREDVAFERARRYAREIVPGFSAFAYFSFAIRAARILATSLYRVRTHPDNHAKIAGIPGDATVVFVMNHRSNMDYVLVTYLAAQSSALSYAVGEWARIWPLSRLIKSMGAYFIRRRSRGQLYRKVLARYVQMATQGGVTQAMYPEGGLSLTGAMAPPKLGLLSYIVGGVGERETDRDVIFVPVALNYDQVLEDRFLVAAGQRGVRRFRPPLLTVLEGLTWYLWRVLTRRQDGFGTAAVGFGAPLALKGFRGSGEGDLTEEVAAELMDRIAAVVPVLAGPLVARALLRGADSREAVQESVRHMLSDLQNRGMPLTQRRPEDLTQDMLRRLARRGLIRRRGDAIAVTDEGRPLLDYYANTIAHHFADENPPRN